MAVDQSQRAVSGRDRERLLGEEGPLMGADELLGTPLRRQWVGGYRTGEVEALLEEAARTIRACVAQVRELKAALAATREREEAVQRALVLAEQTAERLAGAAEAEARQVVASAVQQAERIVHLAQQEERLIQSKNADLERSLAVLRGHVLQLLRSQVLALESLPASIGELAHPGVPVQGRS